MLDISSHHLYVKTVAVGCWTLLGLTRQVDTQLAAGGGGGGPGTVVTSGGG